MKKTPTKLYQKLKEYAKLIKLRDFVLLLSCLEKWKKIKLYCIDAHRIASLSYAKAAIRKLEISTNAQLEWQMKSRRNCIFSLYLSGNVRQSKFRK